MKNIKKIIIILIVIILIIILTIANTIMSTIKQQENEVMQELEEQEMLQKKIIDEESNIIKKITTEAEYFNVKKCIDYYKSCSNYLYYAQQYDALSANEKENVEIEKEQLLSLMPEFVCEKLKLKKENIYNEIGLPNKEMRIDSVYVSTQKVKSSGEMDKINVKAYIASGVYIDRDNLQKEQFNIIVLMDTYKNTFAIVPQKYIELENIELKERNELTLYESESIEKNDYNEYEETIETEEEMSKEYLNRLRMNLMNDTSYIYDKFEGEYRNKRFGTYENFLDYVKQNRENLEKIKLTSYLVNHNENDTEYICKDQYENMYIFEQTNPLEFSLRLDTYTIPTDNFKETYNSSEDAYKCQMNIDKFFQMINRQDYKTAYNYLAEGYKNNYFKTEEEFTNFAKNTFYTYNEVTYNSYEQKGNRLFVFKIKLNDLTGESTDKKEVKIIMQLNDNLNFEISFGM